MVSVVKNLPANAGNRIRSLGWEIPLMKEMATHSNILAWEIPQTKEPGGLYRPWSCQESDTTEHTHARMRLEAPHPHLRGGILAQRTFHTQQCTLLN